MKRGIDKEYEIYWLVENKQKYKNDKLGVIIDNTLKTNLDEI